MHVLVIRLSAMGDVALTAPVLHSLLEQNPSLKITLVTNGFFEPFFNTSNRLQVVAAETKGKHKGVPGLRKLYSEIKHNKFDAVVDLHDVIRSKILRSFFKLSGTKTICFNKGRKEKQALLNPNNEFKKLPHTTERYFDAFQNIGLKTGMVHAPWTQPKGTQKLLDFLSANKCATKNQKWIGIAPFAMHESKMWGLEKIENLIERLEKEQNSRVFLFGGGASEIEKLKTLNEKYMSTIVVAGNLDLANELQLMQQLDTLISMDSSNMHMMSILGKPVVSIWGGTHHFVGFGPINNEHLIVEVAKKELNCRPSTIYGKTNEEELECAKKAMNGITIEMVMEKVNHATS